VGSDEGVALAVVVVDCDAPVDRDAVGDGATLLDKLTDEVIDGALVPDRDGATEGLREMDVVAGFDGLAEIEMDGLCDAPVLGDAVGCCEADSVRVVDCDGADVPVPVGVRVGEGVTGGVCVGVAVPVGVWVPVDVGVGLVKSRSEHMPAPNVLLHVHEYGLLYCGCGSGTSAGTSGQFGLPLLGIVHDAEQQCVSAVVGSRPAPEKPLVVVHS
jgi:hypothetical protein